MASRRRIGPLDRLGQLIHTIRGQRVMLDADIARLYGVPTKALLQAVKRNAERFPADFMLRLTEREAAALRSQTVTANMPRGGRRTLPFAFTEQGVAMLSSVLNSERAIQVNIAIMRAFVHLRQLLATHEELAAKLVELERKYDEQFQVVFDAIRQLMAPPDPAPKKIGFSVRESRARYRVHGRAQR